MARQTSRKECVKSRRIEIMSDFECDHRLSFFREMNFKFICFLSVFLQTCVMSGESCFNRYISLISPLLLSLEEQGSPSSYLHKRAFRSFVNSSDRKETHEVPRKQKTCCLRARLEGPFPALTGSEFHEKGCSVN